MTRRYGLLGDRSRDWITFGGRILWHDNPHELAYLFPSGVKVGEVPRDIPDQQMLPIREHPAMASTRFPLQRSDFRAA